jgi:phage/plasmid-associated DNA primase
MASNYVPHLEDFSDALVGRFVGIKLKNSFAGGEDPGLLKRLQSEAPQIFWWMASGWRMLQESRRFPQPESGRVVIEELKGNTNPMKRFIADCCVLGEDRTVPKFKLLRAWKEWARQEGERVDINDVWFSRELNKVASVSPVQLGGRDGPRIHSYRGIGISNS